MAKALQSPFGPLTELARKNMELWEQMQAATRSAFGAPAAAETKSASRKSETDSKADPKADPNKGK
jgi:hypothetical protein